MNTPSSAADAVIEEVAELIRINVLRPWRAVHLPIDGAVIRRAVARGRE